MVSCKVEDVGIGYRIVLEILDIKFGSYKIFDTEEEAYGYIWFVVSKVNKKNKE